MVHTPYRNDCIYTFSMDGVEGAGPLPTGANARAGRARPDQSYLDAGADFRFCPDKLPLWTASPCSPQGAHWAARVCEMSMKLMHALQAA